MEKIQAGIGDKLSLFLNYFSTFITGFVVAFTISWKMAFVVAVMLPLLAFMAGIIAKVTTKLYPLSPLCVGLCCCFVFLDSQIIATFTVREQKAYASAGGVAEEVFSAIRTVVAFGGEAHEAERYGT